MAQCGKLHVVGQKKVCLWNVDGKYNYVSDKLKFTYITCRPSPAWHTLTSETTLSINTCSSMLTDRQVGALIEVNFTSRTHPVRRTFTCIRTKCVLANTTIETRVL